MCLFDNFESSLSLTNSKKDEKKMKKLLELEEPERCYLCKKLTPWAYKFCLLPLKKGRKK